MTRPRRVGVVEDPRFRDHVGPPGHPERPERLAAVGEAIAARADALERLAPRPATSEEILRVHSAEHRANLARAAERAPVRLDPDTYLGAASLPIAELAAGAAVDLARAVARGDLDAGLAAIRPPGHHAEGDRAMGFCLLNNVAIAARAVQADEGVDKLLILDWDVHHGNGTQHTFETDPSVLFASTHQFPCYPGTGDFGEVGVGRGEGTTVNVPLPAGCGDSEYAAVAQRLLVPVARAFRPELILVSCGFDAHRDDPLADMQLGAEGFRGLAAVVRALADELCGGRLVLLLEGGYALSGLREGTGAVLDVLLEPEAPELPELTPVVSGHLIDGILSRVDQAHGRKFSGLGSP
jgi:acetoin utilization deacetylase AcuC-like enzyme